uniref:Mitochondrial thiamine pyrophosphate carrier n=1 Tax=Phlebotomus papatasi TaxID=29031 RepID=A0A1B0EZA7_PHLPP
MSEQNWKNAVAGASSGAITRFLCQPLDVLKIRFQVQIEPLSYAYHTSKYKSIIHALTVIYSEEGIRGLWKGHNPAQILSIGYGITQFTVYERVNRSAETIEFFQKHKLLKNFCCGGFAGATAAFVSTPLDVIRTRLIVQDAGQGYRNSVQAVGLILRKDGIRGLYRGFGPSLLQITPLAGSNFMFYKFYCGLLQNLLGAKSHSDLPTWGLLLMGSLTGFSSRALVYPLDVIKKRLQIQGFAQHHQTFGKHFECEGFIQCVIRTSKTEGFLGFYKGIVPSMLKSGITTALNFCIYDETKKILAQI